ncbi:MAG: TIGR02266 family protein [Deltaproteobacteria bacterium]|nr:MAG: TIGR02266 family protein [Deltaproteobacteria bacterium]
MAPPDDLRKSPRAPIRLRVDYERMNSFFADYTANISKGGTFIKTERPLPIGTRCLFSFSLPALSEPLQLEGEVSWILPPETARERGENPGMGVRFLFSERAAQREFEDLVERMMEQSLGEEVAQGLLER